MIKMWMKHKIYEYSISMLFDNISLTFSNHNSNNKIILYGHQINQSHIGLNVFDIYHRHGYITSDTIYNKCSSFHPLYAIEVKGGIIPILKEQQYIIKL